ncbi:Glycosyltransferase, GT2 family [Lutibacter agarilyticus]|uniref:Glycosyltransferase, GT2 family n=1 Tax=Lutibacter agarilyticus TaxID=1109740 RepID=A0A238YX12_9FLAO|nr:glycosyltransferase [Lutibacter agarilyticus]SNR75806.1 Glycosyltransferase, GT2 family [Lutibacter agarilyticus]
MKFSLIICTYQRPKALITLLDSVEKQTLYPNEIIIVDGSLDTATEMALENKTYQNLSYYLVSEERRGLTKQRNFGISKVADECEISCFLDDDTILANNYFEQLINTYSNYSEALAVGGFINNEVNWEQSNRALTKSEYGFDGYIRKEGSRFILRKKLGLIDETLPGFMPVFSNGRSVSFLPPSGNIYEVEQLMGGVASYRKEVFQKLQFSTYFEGYGLYEDADFSLRVAKTGKLYINTAAQLEHHHEPSGRPNQYRYGKMVVRNGWYVWHVKYPKPSLNARFKWNAIVLLLIGIRFTNIFTTTKPKEAFTEASGRLVGWFSLFFNKPKVEK